MAFPSLGVDLGGTNVRAAVVDSAGKILGQAKTRIAEDRRPGPVVERCREVIRQAADQAGLSLEDCQGLGLGVAGLVRGESGVVANGPNLGWREVPLGDLVEKSLGRQPVVVNDLDAIAWGEVQHGAAQGHNHALVVFAGTGVGAGFILGGRLQWGAGGVAGEIGHVKVRGPEGAPCGCGARGCLEAYLGGKNLSERLQEGAKAWPSLAAKASGRSQDLHPGMVDELAREGDERAKVLWKELAEMFGDVLANAITLSNPSILVLGGTVAEGCPELMRRVEERLRLRAAAVSLEVLEIVGAQLGDDAGIIGAADLGRLGQEGV